MAEKKLTKKEKVLICATVVGAGKETSIPVE